VLLSVVSLWCAFSYTDIRTFKKKPYLVGGNQEPNCTNCLIDDGLAGEPHPHTNRKFRLVPCIMICQCHCKSNRVKLAHAWQTAVLPLHVFDLHHNSVVGRSHSIHSKTEAYVMICRVLQTLDMSISRAEGLSGAPGLPRRARSTRL